MLDDVQGVPLQHDMSDHAYMGVLQARIASQKQEIARLRRQLEVEQAFSDGLISAIETLRARVAEREEYIHDALVEAHALGVSHPHLANYHYMSPRTITRFKEIIAEMEVSGE